MWKIEKKKPSKCTQKKKKKGQNFPILSLSPFFLLFLFLLQPFSYTLFIYCSVKKEKNDRLRRKRPCRWIPRGSVTNQHIYFNSSAMNTYVISLSPRARTTTNERISVFRLRTPAIPQSFSFFPLRPLLPSRVGTCLSVLGLDFKISICF